MPNTHATLTSLFSDIAQAIRDKKGETSEVKYVADNFPTAIAGIPTGSGGSSITGYSSFTKQTSVGNTEESGTKNITYTVQKNANALYYVICFSAFAHIYTVDATDAPTTDNAIGPAILCNAVIVLDADGDVIARFGDQSSTAQLIKTSFVGNNVTLKATYRALAGMYVSTCLYGGYLIGS